MKLWLLAILAFIAACSASPEVDVGGPCNGADRAACVSAKSVSFQLSAGAVKQPDILYRAFEYGCALPDADACWMLGQLLSGDEQFISGLQDRGYHDRARDDPVESGVAIKRSCDLGSTYGCLLHAANLLASRGLRGDPLPPDSEQQMLNGFYDSCQAGFVSGCGGFVDAILAFGDTGLFERHDNLTAQEQFASRKVCEADIATGCTLLAISIWPQAEDEKVRTEARNLMRRSCELGGEWGCRTYVELFAKAGSEDYTWAIHQACEAGFKPETWDMEPRITGCDDR